MDRFEHPVRVADVPARSHPHPALKHRREVRRDVPELVRRDGDVVRLRGTDEPLEERVDVRVILRDPRIVGRDLVVHLSEEPVPRHDVRLVHARDAGLPICGRAFPRLREVERVPDHALRALPRDHAAVHCELVHAAAGEEPAGGRVQALRVLPHDHEVHLARLPHLFE